MAFDTVLYKDGRNLFVKESIFCCGGLRKNKGEVEGKKKVQEAHRISQYKGSNVYYAFFCAI